MPVTCQSSPARRGGEAGRRTVTLPAVAAVALAEHLAEYDERDQAIAAALDELVQVAANQRPALI